MNGTHHSAVEMRPNLAQLLLPHVPEPGLHDMPVSGVSAFRSDGAIGRAPCIYDPCIVVVVQGTKRGYLGAEVFDYAPGKYLVFSIPQPMESEIVAASPDEPFLGLALDIDPAIITDLQMQIDTAAPAATGEAARSTAGRDRASCP